MLLDVLDAAHDVPEVGRRLRVVRDADHRRIVAPRWRVCRRRRAHGDEHFAVLHAARAISAIVGHGVAEYIRLSPVKSAISRSSSAHISWSLREAYLGLSNRLTTPAACAPAS